MTEALTHESGRRRAIAALSCGLGVLAIASGLWLAFNASLSLWPLNADNAVPLALWRGVQRHGLGFLADWYHTSDNWLLSLLPIAAVAYSVAGPQLVLLVAFGWAVFASCVILAGLIAGRLFGWRAGLLTSGVLAFANYEALGAAGYLSHPVTHNISMAWGLAALLLAVVALQRRAAWAAGLCAAAVLIDVISDPWAGAAIAAPLVLAAGAVAIWRRNTDAGRAARLVCGLVLAAFVLALTKLLGLFAFLPSGHVTFGGAAGMLASAYWALRSFSQTFAVAPAVWTDGWQINLAALAGLLLASVAVIFREAKRLDPEAALVAMTALLSLSGVTAPFLLGQWNADVSVGRFFPNLYFLGALLVVIAAAVAPRGQVLFRIAVAVYATFFVVNAATSNPQLWGPHRGNITPARAQVMGDFLRSEGLSYGYGPYWGAHTLIMDVATEGAVTIRAVSFMSGQVARRPAQTSSYWYRASDEPKDDGRRFLVVMNDGEECPDVRRCLDMALRQFGPPERTLTFESATILVWPHPIAGRIAQ